MKLRGDQLSLDEVQREVIRIVARTSGAKLERILPGALLRDDLRICGDDGEDLLLALDERFEMNWTSLDSGIYFGNEATLGLPLPWQIGKNCISFEPQELTVAALSQAICAGVWPGTPRIPVSPRRLRTMQVVSSVQWLLIATLLLGTILAIAHR